MTYYSDFISFSIISLFYFVPGSHSGYLITVYPCISLACSVSSQILRLLLFLITLRVLKITSRIFCRMNVSILIHLIFSYILIVILELQVLKSKIREVKYHSYHSMSKVHTFNMTYHYSY